MLEKDKDAAAELLRGCQADLRKAQRQRQEAQVCVLSVTALKFTRFTLFPRKKKISTNTAKQTCARRSASGKRRRWVLSVTTLKCTRFASTKKKISKDKYCEADQRLEAQALSLLALLVQKYEH